MNNYKIHFLSLIVSLPFMALVNGNKAIASSSNFVKITTDYTVQDTEPKQQSGKPQKDNLSKEQPKTDKQSIGDIKSVPKARRQAKPNVVKPNIDVIKTVRPIIKPKIEVPVRIPVRIKVKI